MKLYQYIKCYILGIWKTFLERQHIGFVCSVSLLITLLPINDLYIHWNWHNRKFPNWSTGKGSGYWEPNQTIKGCMHFTQISYNISQAKGLCQCMSCLRSLAYPETMWFQSLAIVPATAAYLTESSYPLLRCWLGWQWRKNHQGRRLCMYQVYYTVLQLPVSTLTPLVLSTHKDDVQDTRIGNMY